MSRKYSLSITLIAFLGLLIVSAFSVQRSVLADDGDVPIESIVYVPSLPEGVNASDADLVANSIEDALTLLPSGGKVYLTSDTSVGAAEIFQNLEIESYGDTAFRINRGQDIQGPMFHVSGASLTLNNVDIDATVPSEAIVDEDVRPSLHTVSADNNASVSFLNGTTVENNTLTTAVWATDTSVKVDSAVFKNNRNSTELGGALYITGASSFEMTNSEFSSNSAYRGGAAYILGDGINISIKGSRIFDNEAPWGGALYPKVSHANIAFEDTEFKNNRATEGGGGVAWCSSVNGTNFTIKGCTASDNHAAASGGVFGGDFLDGSELNLDTSSFTNNSADESCGVAAFTLAASNATFKGSTFDSNIAEGDGGVFEMTISDNALLRIDDSDFLNNVSHGVGGAFSTYMDNANIEIDGDSVFKGNSAAANGGAFATYRSGDSGEGTVDLIACEIVENVCTAQFDKYADDPAYQQSVRDYNSGGIYVGESITLHMNDAEVTENHVDDGFTGQLIGSGISVCPHGSVELNSDHGAKIHNNGDGVGMDLFLVPWDEASGHEIPSELYISDVTPDGKEYNWTDLEGSEARTGYYSWSTELKEQADSEGVNVATPTADDPSEYQGETNLDPVGFRANISEPEIMTLAASDEFEPKVIIADNSSASSTYGGGGIMVNGQLIAGEFTVSVEKQVVADGVEPPDDSTEYQFEFSIEVTDPDYWPSLNECDVSYTKTGSDTSEEGTLHFSVDGSNSKRIYARFGLKNSQTIEMNFTKNEIGSGLNNTGYEMKMFLKEIDNGGASKTLITHHAYDSSGEEINDYMTSPAGTEISKFTYLVQNLFYESGSLRLTKTMGQGSPNAMAGQVYTFEITSDIELEADGYSVSGGEDENVSVVDGKAIVHLKGNSTATIYGLRPGTYTVKEVRDGTELPGFSLDVSGEGDFQIVAGETIEREIVNTYWVNKIAATLDGETELVIENVYDELPTFTPQVQKALERYDGSPVEGYDFSTNHFEFEISSASGAPLPSKTTVTTDDTGLAKWPSIGLPKEPATYTYEIQEVEGNVPGVSYDTKTYTLTVTVNDDGTVSQEWSGKTINNEKRLVYLGTISEGVTIENVKLDAAGHITSFEWLGYNRNTCTIDKFDIIDNNLVIEYSTPTDGYIYASLRHALGEGGYDTSKIESGQSYALDLFNIERPQNKFPDATHCIAFSTVRSEGPHDCYFYFKLVESDGTPVITNTYFEPVPFTPQVQKALAQRDGTAVEGFDFETNHFTFRLAAYDPSDAPRPAEAMATTDNAGLATWGEISFSSPGTYTYIITEETGSVPDVEYDKNPHYLKVTVANDGTITTVWDDGAEPVAAALEADAVDYPTDATQIAQDVKYVLPGAPEGSWLMWTDLEKVGTGVGDYETESSWESSIAGSYGVALYPKLKAINPVTSTIVDESTVSVSLPKVVDWAENIYGGYATQRVWIKLDAGESHSFETDLRSVDMGRKPNGYSGNDSYKLDGTDNGSGTVTYSIDSTDMSRGYFETELWIGFCGFEAGDPGWGEGPSFEGQTISNGIAPISYGGEEYPGWGIYKFKIHIPLATSASAVPTITNTYVPKVPWQPKVQKQMADTDGAAVENWDYTSSSFTFEISGDDPYSSPVQATTDATGLATWPEIELECGRTYNFKVSEVKGEVPDVTYDTEEHTLKVTVANDGTITEEWDDETLKMEKELKLLNENIDGRVHLGDFDGNPERPSYFTWVGYDFSNQTISFEAPLIQVSYYSSGLLSPTSLSSGDTVNIEELSIMNMSSNGKESLQKLYPSVTHVIACPYNAGSEFVDLVDIAFELIEKLETPTVTNIYAPKTSLALSLQKKYVEKDTDEELTVEQGQFSFTLTPKTDTAPMPTDPMAKTDADGKVTWPEIVFDKVGEWDYTVTENDPNDPSVEWDKTQHKVHVSVTRNADRTLSASWTWDGESANSWGASGDGVIAYPTDKDDIKQGIKYILPNAPAGSWIEWTDLEDMGEMGDGYSEPGFCPPFESTVLPINFVSIDKSSCVIETLPCNLEAHKSLYDKDTGQEIFGKSRGWSASHYHKTNLLGHTVDKEELRYSDGENVIYTVTSEDIEQGYFEEEIEIYFNVPQLGDPANPEQPGISLASFTEYNYYGVYKFMFHIPLNSDSSVPTITNYHYEPVHLPLTGSTGIQNFITVAVIVMTVTFVTWFVYKKWQLKRQTNP